MAKIVVKFNLIYLWFLPLVIWQIIDIVDRGVKFVLFPKKMIIFPNTGGEYNQGYSAFILFVFL